MSKQEKTKTKKVSSNKQVSPYGIAFVYSGYNNTMVTITDMDGNAVCWESGGSSKFKGSRKATPYAATVIGESAGREAVSKGVKEVEVYIKGPGSGRDAALRALKSAGLRLLLIADVTPIPHNGPRPSKPRRV